MNEIPHPVHDQAVGRRWPWRLAVAFVVLTLIALVMVPWLVQRRVNALREEIVAAEPARTLVTRWQFNLVREMAALSELVLTGDTAEVDAFTAARAAEDQILSELTPIVGRISPAVVEQFVEARSLAYLWHERVYADPLLRLRAEGVSLEQIPRERPLFNELVRTVGSVDSAIVATTARTRAQIGEAEQTGLNITLLLGVLALLAAAAVLALEQRVRRFAAETERRRAEAADALAESARATEARNRLLRGVSHDVKNPLGAAKGYAELLAMEVKAPLAPEQAPLVKGVQRSIDSALAIIGDLLDLARLGSGGISVDRIEVDLGAVAREAAADHGAAAEAAGHSIEAETPEDRITVHTDPIRVRQVIDNLVSNAIKYTPPPGQIVIRAGSKRGDDAPRPGSWGTIEVSDTGPGIPPEQREAVFDEFTRLDEGSSAKGHGLGLAIARGLSRRLGGDLTIADTTTGATFVLWIPRRD